MESLKNLKKALSGLLIIFKLNFDEDDFFRQIAEDNITILGEEIPKILYNTENKSEILKGLKKFKFNQSYTKHKNLSVKT